MCLGGLVFHLGRRLDGAQWLLLIPLIGSGYLAFLPLVAWPAIIAVHGDTTDPVTTLAGLAGIATQLAAFHLLTLQLAPRPAHTPGRIQVPVERGRVHSQHRHGVGTEPHDEASGRG
ncbi:hypothetical protein ACH4SP_11865 [Streptomyces sp. NPDC021093]|uniref:hypothetical protein n=1 Tax=Streptomyces sp. NPDC021093 TaxID=3365112 RepID=UPI0037B0FC5C